MKTRILSALTAAAILWGVAPRDGSLDVQPSEAVLGCGLTFYVTSASWNNSQFSVSIVRANGNIIAISRWDTSEHSVDNGDRINVVDMNHCTGAAYNWGGKVWYHCGATDPPVPLTLNANALNTVYEASAVCQCPYNTHGQIDRISEYLCQQ